MPDTRPIQSVRQAMDLVETLTELGGATVSEIANELNMPQSTAHDYLRTLYEEGYATNDAGEYHASLRFLDLGGRLRQKYDVFTIARPELRTLANETGEHASLVVEEEGHGVVLHTEIGGSMERAVVHTGSRAYLHTTAPGKAILAALDENPRNELLDRMGLPPVTANTITQRDVLEEELTTIREEGYAIDREEILDGMRGIATSISNSENRVQGAICLYGPVTGKYIEEQIDQLLQTANIIEVNLTYE